MSEQPHPSSEIITGIPAHLRTPEASSLGVSEPETPQYNTTFYIEKPLEGGGAIATPGWKEVSTTLAPDEQGDYWTTLKGEDGSIVQMQTAKLYALQDRLGNPVAPRELLPFAPEQTVTPELQPKPAVDFIEDAGQVAVPEVVRIDEVNASPHVEAHSLAKSLDFLSGRLADDLSPRGYGFTIQGSIEGMLKRGEVSADDPSVLQLLDIAGTLANTRGNYADPQLSKKAKAIIASLRQYTK